MEVATDVEVGGVELLHPSRFPDKSHFLKTVTTIESSSTPSEKVNRKMSVKSPAKREIWAAVLDGSNVNDPELACTILLSVSSFVPSDSNYCIVRMRWTLDDMDRFRIKSSKSERQSKRGFRSLVRKQAIQEAQASRSWWEVFSQ
jgi:hypothetical protein